MLPNPLIIATVAGLLVKASGLTVPQTATTFLAHLGNDSLAMGLLCIGAGLRLHDFRDHLALITTSVVCRLLAVPAIAWGAVTLAGLDPVEAGVAILFAALPTAQSCYVMTASMKGDAPSRAETGIRERQMHERPQDRVSLRASHCSIRDEVRPTRGVARASEEACGGSILPSRRRPGARGTCGLRRA